MINVTKTYLPDINEYKKYVDEIYSNGWVTNNGPLVRKLEEKLAQYLGIKNIILVSNGTAALEIAYRALDIEGEVITTPFSFVATTSSLVTNNITPIFADIDPNSLNIDYKDIEKLITKKTSAIVATHIFGNGCEIEAIKSIASKYSLKIIYDAAHAFGVKYKDRSILNCGDISTLSFHATKLFHTIEGGAVIVNDDKLVEKIRYLINFGIENTESIPHLGINAKMNEFEAAMGLCMLENTESINQERKNIHDFYVQSLKGYVQFPIQSEDTTKNYSYFPLVFKSEQQLLDVQKVLNDNDIYPRRYFFPSLDTLNYIKPKQYSPISRDISKRILCIPFYPELSKSDQLFIVKLIKGVL